MKTIRRLRYLNRVLIPCSYLALLSLWWLLEEHHMLLWVVRLIMILFLSVLIHLCQNGAGLLQCDGWEFVEIALLACFCAIHIHGFDMLFSFSAIVQHCPSPPIGFSILKAGLNKSVLLSVYASRNSRCRQGHSSSGIVLLEPELSGWNLINTLLISFFFFLNPFQ